jgi:hypothetical protein
MVKINMENRKAGRGAEKGAWERGLVMRTAGEQSEAALAAEDG